VLASPARAATAPPEPSHRVRARPATKRQTAGEPEPEPEPISPPAPPGRGNGAFAGSSGTSAGGAAAALLCAVLVGFLFDAIRASRRHRVRLLLAGPAGVRSPQQRPG
jgi:hypothetical protein